MLMSKQIFKIEASPTVRELTGRVLAGKVGIAKDERDMMRRQGRRLKVLAQQEAPKRTGQFAESIRFRTFVEGDTSGFTITSAKPLGRFIIGGTKKHPIVAHGKSPLTFYWPKMGRVVQFRSVEHPGTKPNRFIGRAFRRWLPGARSDLRTVAKNYTRTLAGGVTKRRGINV